MIRRRCAPYNSSRWAGFPTQEGRQRVSAHVVPKAHAVLGATTTRRRRSNRVGGRSVDDDRRAGRGRRQDPRARRRSAHATDHGASRRRTVAPSTSPPSTISARTRASRCSPPPPSVPARLVITQGNDTGAGARDRRPARPTRSVARSTTTSCSPTSRCRASTSICATRTARGCSSIAARGNGTLVNGNVEDAPFMLANGDTIEIGNTMFRFDNPNGVSARSRETSISTSKKRSRRRSPASRWGVSPSRHP